MLALKWPRCSLILLALLTWPCHGFEMGVAHSQVPPFATIIYTKSGPQLRETDLLYRLGQYIAKRTGESTTFTIVKRPEVAQQLNQNQVQSVCYMTPKWLPDANDEIVFTNPFLINRERVISRSSIEDITTKEQLKGFRIGLINGFHYPAIAELVERKEVTPVYFDKETATFVALFRRNNIDAVIFKERSFRHLLSVMPHMGGEDKIRIHPLSLGEVEVSCALSKSGRRYLDSINAAINDFITDHPL